MPVVSGTEFLKATHKDSYAVGGYNTNNLEWAQAILGATEAKEALVLIQTSISVAKYTGGYKVAKDMITNLVDLMNITVPVAIHLDRGDYEAALECIGVGYTSIVFSSSHLPFEENLKLAGDVVEEARAKGISVECEVDSIGDEENGIIDTGELAGIGECERMTVTSINYLACGIGSIRGQHPENWKDLVFDRLRAVAEAVGSNVPLVLHGGFGIPQKQIKKAISVGILKASVNTEFQLSFAKATRECIEAGRDSEGKGFSPRKLLTPGKVAIIKDAEEHVDWFGLANEA